MDLWRIGRLTEIGVDWLWFPRPFRAANAVPIRQSRANPMPIETPFWIGDFSSIRENRGQSCAMQTPIRCQSGLIPTARLLPIQCQSVANELPIRCQSQATSQGSGVCPFPIQCQSISNPVSIECQSDANANIQSQTDPMSIRRQSDANREQIHCQSDANRKPRNRVNRLPIHRQPITNRVPIHRESIVNPLPI